LLLAVAAALVVAFLLGLLVAAALAGIVRLVV